MKINIHKCTKCGLTISPEDDGLCDRCKDMIDKIVEWSKKKFPFEKDAGFIESVKSE